MAGSTEIQCDANTTDRRMDDPRHQSSILSDLCSRVTAPQQSSLIRETSSSAEVSVRKESEDNSPGEPIGSPNPASFTAPTAPSSCVRLMRTEWRREGFLARGVDSGGRSSSSPSSLRLRESGLQIYRDREDGKVRQETGKGGRDVTSWSALCAAQALGNGVSIPCSRQRTERRGRRAGK
jgi:hypothetical protein